MKSPESNQRFALLPDRWALPVFVLVIWLFSTLGQGGRLGRSTDDYSFNVSDPVTGPPPLSKFDPGSLKSSFWRPVHQWVLHLGRTYFDQYDRGLHIFLALTHGLVCWLLYRLLRKTTGCAGVSAVVSILFLVIPLHHEAVFWFCTVGTLFGSGLLTWLSIAMVRWSRGPTTLRSWRTVAPMCVIAFAIPFCYEQPGSAIAALPLLYLAACSREQSIRQRLIRSLGLTFFLGLTQVAFAIALLKSASPGERASTTSMISAAEAPGRAMEIARMTVDCLAGQHARAVFGGSWTVGAKSLSSTILWVWPLVAALAACAWVAACARRRGTDAQAAPETQPFRWYWLALFGVAAAVLSMLPVAMVRGQSIAPRIVYMPLLGLAVSAAAVLTAVRGATPSVWRVGSARAAAAGIAAVLIIVASVCMLGVQRTYQRAAKLDDRMIQGLANLLSEAPRNTLCVPVYIKPLASRTGFVLYDAQRPLVFETNWSATPPVQRAMKRRDVYVSSRNPWVHPDLTHATKDTVDIRGDALGWTPFTRVAGDRARLAWRQVVPFTVELGGEVRLVRRVVFENEDGSELSITPPITADLLQRGRLPADATQDVRIDNEGSAGRVTDIDGWTWNGGSAVEQPSLLSVWRDTCVARTAVWMHPSASDGQRSGMHATLPPSTARRRVVLRGTVTEYDLQHNPNAAPMTLELLADDQSVASVVVDPASIRTARRWLTVAADLPPSAAPVRLTIRLGIAAGASSKHSSHGICWVTPARVTDAPEGELPGGPQSR